MSTGNEFEIILGADGEPLQKSLKEMQADLKRFSKELETTFDPKTVAGLNKSINETQKNIERLKGFGVNAFAGLKPSAKEASFALNDFSRIAQDLPYGLMGIQNNIPMVIDSFGRLKQETGSAGAALKAMAGSLIGPAGLGLAVSAIMAGLTIYQNGIAGFNKKTQEAADKVKSLADNLKDVQDVLNSGKGSVEGEVALVQSLSKGILDANKSYEERANLLQRLKNVNKSYFGDLEMEDSKLAKLTGTVKAYTDALIQESVVNAFSSEIGEVAKKLRTANKETDLALKKYEQLAERLKKTPETTTSLTGEERVSGAYIEAKKAAEAAYDEFLKFNDVSRTLALTQADLKTALNESAQALSGFKPTVSTEDTKVKTENTKRSLADLFTIINLEMGQGWKKAENDAQKNADQFWDGVEKGLVNKERLRKIQQELKGELESERLGITAIKPPVDIFPDLPLNFDIPAIDAFGKIRQEFVKLGANPPNFDWTLTAAQNVELASQSLQTLQKRMFVVGDLANEFLAPAFHTLFSDLVSGTRSIGEAFTTMLKNIARQMAATLATAAALAAIMSIFGGGTFGNNFIKYLGGSGPKGSGLGNIFDKLFSGGGSMALARSGPSAGSMSGIAMNAAASSLNVIVTGRMSGRDIQFTNARSSRMISRLGG